MSTYWFRKRRGFESSDHGVGWVPITWQGWGVVVGCAGLIIAVALGLGLFTDRAPSMLKSITFIVSIIGIIALGAFISQQKVKP